VDTLELTATDVGAPKMPALDLSAVAVAPQDEPAIQRWPGAVRLGILLGGAAAVWVAIGWIALRIAHLG